MKPPRKGTKRAWGACCAAIGRLRPSRARFVPLRGGQSRASVPDLPGSSHDRTRMMPRQCNLPYANCTWLHQRGQGT